ncbi:MAG: FecR family protein [Niastella sp.]|uniref:FecR family protein n=1 Tax=Niastella sp. TaxID=1869183 RepID=UPI00389AB1B3
MNRSFPQLLALFETGQLTGSELDQFFQLLEIDDNRALLAAAIDEKAMDESRLPPEQGLLTERAVASLKEAMQGLPMETSTPAPVRAIRPWKYVGWAAAALLVIAAGWYLFNKNQQQPATDTLATTQDVKAPQNNRAMITLADGQRIYLDSTANGVLLKQGSTQLVKSADGQIHYYQQRTGTSEPVNNTLFNPRGSRIINIELADGTKVWLNAGSSLSYPVYFTGNERKVTITGEAYFEVAHNAQKPFIVNVNNKEEVTVLGTHFNINAYEDENAIQTTLLQGSVKVAIGNRQSAIGNEKSVVLKPGEQAILSQSSQKSQTIPVQTVETDEVIAWKNGRFVFGDKADAATIMRQVARWYDLEVELQGNFTQHFGGSISREASAAEVFKVLEATGGLHCKITGRKVIVTQG